MARGRHTSSKRIISWAKTASQKKLKKKLEEIESDKLLREYDFSRNMLNLSMDIFPPDLRDELIEAAKMGNIWLEAEIKILDEAIEFIKEMMLDN